MSNSHRFISNPARRLASVVAGVGCLAAFRAEAQIQLPGTGSAGDASPWGIASSASSSRTYDQWLPKMSEAGVTWARMFPGWGEFEPRPGQWKFDAADKMVAEAAKNNIHLSALFAYSAPWAMPYGVKGSAFPMQHLADWSQYCERVVAKYKDQVHYWEVWNEGNGSFKGHYADGHSDSTIDYAKLSIAAYAAAKKSDPNAKVGLSVASYDAPYLDETVLAQAKLKAPESFDYFCIHPYEIIGGLSEADGEIPYLWMAKLLRDEMKIDAPDRPNPEIWITEIGRVIGNKKESQESDEVSEDVAAKTLAKAYLMAIAQGIQKVCWFEAQDPHGEPPGYGLLHIDGAPRPSWTTMKAMTSVLGPVPKSIGWLALGDGGKAYGFVFQGAMGPVLAMWMPFGGVDNTISFTGNVKVTNTLTGANYPCPAGRALPLSGTPLLIADLPPDMVAQAQANASKNYPWGGDYSTSSAVSIQLGDPNTNNGIIQVERGWTTPYKFDDGSTGQLLSQPGKHDNQAIKFIVHPSFANLKTSDYYVRVTARRTAPPASFENYCKLTMVYEIADSHGDGPMRVAGRDMLGRDLTAYKGDVKGEEFLLTADAKSWQTHTWHVTDASFAKMWNYDIAFLIDKSDPFVIGKVEVSTKPFDK
jgi:hypothetical protein